MYRPDLFVELKSSVSRGVADSLPARSGNVGEQTSQRSRLRIDHREGGLGSEKFFYIIIISFIIVKRYFKMIKTLIFQSACAWMFRHAFSRFSDSF